MKNRVQYDYKVSVVVAVYNVELYINECVDSLIKQSIGFKNIEVILVDDGSIDNSKSICLEYSNKYHNVKVISQENNGVSSARNKGIKNATGKYIMILDSDDFLSSNTINDLYNFFEKHYNEVDLVTYPIYIYNNMRSTFMKRYKFFNKGTDVYDLDEYYYLNQKTVNIIFKNRFENNQLYNEKMKLSEDQDFNTEIVMKKKRIGYVSSARYYYRKIGTGVSKTGNNPFYCFNDIISFNEDLTTRYSKNGVIPKYIQNLIMTTFLWRVDMDELFPYAYSGIRYTRAKNRIYNIIKQIDTDIINNLDTNIYNKLYFLKLSGRKIDYEINNTTLYVKCEDEVVYKNTWISSQVERFELRNNNFYIFSSLMTPFLTFENAKIYLVIKKNSELISTKRINVFPSNKLKKKCDDINNVCYNLDIELPIKEGYEYSFICNIDELTLPLKFDFNDYTAPRITNDKYSIKYRRNGRNSRFAVEKKTMVSNIKYWYNRDRYIFSVNKKAFIYRFFCRLYKRNKIFDLYSDRNDIIDNAYYQFKHDFSINDGIKRYYVTDINKNDLNKYFTKEEKKYLIKSYSLKHKLLFLNARRIYSSFVDLQIYCPFNKAVRFYKDIKKYKLIYLQHGVLHANLVNMYSKEFNEINKFVISSNFEKNNLINNYSFSERDLIKSTMPRMKVSSLSNNNVKNRILFAPSWRKYLIGESRKGKRDLVTHIFLKSNFYNNINNFLKSKSLNDYLKENNLVLDIKMHPNLSGYNNLFYTNDNIQIIDSNVNLDEYKLFITDFSSFQFDYIKLIRPIIYFIPDYDEFISGLHTYRKLDLKYEDAFGPLCKNSTEMIQELTKIIDNNFVMDKKYKDRMINFFYKVDDPCDIIYEDGRNEN